MLRLLDLFCGCGGMTAGFASTGRFSPVRAIDNDADAVETYNTNFPGQHAVCADIRFIENFPTADVVVGGPPCQGFSTLNRGGVGSERRALWWEYYRALKASGARAFVMENVPQLLISPEFQEFRAHLDCDDDGTWSLTHDVLDAADFGVPQRRRRAIVIGVRDAEAPWPQPTHCDPARPTPGLKRWRTFAEATRGLPAEPDGRRWHRARKPTAVSLIRYSAVPLEGGDRFQMQRELESRGLAHLVPPCWQKKKTGTTDVFGRLWSDRPSVTLRTEFYKPEKGRYLHPREDRPLTIAEGARLMSFSDQFRFPEHQSMTSVGRQIGNAVPPLLAASIASAVANAVEPLVNADQLTLLAR